MRLVIELENEKERTVVTEKIDRVKEIFDDKIEIVYADTHPLDIFEQVEKLKWDMGKKLYRDRDSLHER